MLQKWVFRNKGLCSFIISLIISLAYLFIPRADNIHNIVDFNSIFATALLGVLSFLLTYLLTNVMEHNDKIERHTKYLENFDAFKKEGIISYYFKEEDTCFIEHLKKSSKLCILVVYSNKSISTYINDIRDFLKNPNKELEIILLNPDKTTEAYKYWSKKLEYEEDYLCRRIKEFETMLKDIRRDVGEKAGKIHIYYSDCIPQQSLKIFDDVCFVTLFKTTKERVSGFPIFEIEKNGTGSFYHYVVDDYNALKKQAVCNQEI